MIEPTWLLLGLLAPAVFAAAVVMLLPGRDTTGLWGGVSRFGLPIGLGMAAAVGMLALTGLPPWRPLQGQHWLVMAVIPASVVAALVGSIKAVPPAAAWMLRLVIAGGTAPLLSYALVPYTWSRVEAYAWWVGFGLWIITSWWLLHAFARRGNGRTVVFVLGATCGAIGGVTMASGYLAGGQFAASFAAMLGGGWLAMWVRDAGAGAGAAVVDLSIAPLLGMLIYNWQFGWTMQHDASPYVVAGLLASAPLVACLPLAATRSPKRRTYRGLIVSVLLILAAAGLAGYEAFLRVQASAQAYPY